MSLEWQATTTHRFADSSSLQSFPYLFNPFRVNTEMSAVTMDEKFLSKGTRNDMTLSNLATLVYFNKASGSVVFFGVQGP